MIAKKYILFVRKIISLGFKRTRCYVRNSRRTMVVHDGNLEKYSPETKDKMKVIIRRNAILIFFTISTIHLFQFRLKLTFLPISLVFPLLYLFLL